MPQAGFLWTDELIWDSDVRAFDTEEAARSRWERRRQEKRKTQTVEDFVFPGHRVILQDKINRVGKNVHV